MAKLTREQKKDYAKTLYLKENLTQEEIASRADVSRQTVIRWIKSENWEKLKVSITITREEQLNNLYRQLAEMNTAISGRKPEEGNRYATPAEADTITKLAKAIKQLETEVGLTDITSAFNGLINWLRPIDPKQVKAIAPVLDAYVKSKL